MLGNYYDASIGVPVASFLLVEKGSKIQSSFEKVSVSNITLQMALTIYLVVNQMVRAIGRLMVHA